MIQIISDSVSKVITLIDASHLCAKKIFDIVKLQINSLNCPDSTILLKNDALIFHLFGLAPYNILSQPTRAIYRFGQRGNGLLALFHPFYFCMKRCSLTRLLPMCVFLCMFRLLASLACRLEFQMHATPKRIWNETIKIKKKKTKNGTKTYQNWRFDAWAVLDICHSVKPSGATQKMVRRTPTPVRSLRSRKIRWTRKPARSLSGVACCREVFRVSRRCTIKW